MKEEKNEIAKECYILSKQLAGLEDKLKNDEKGLGYRSYVENYNEILNKGKELLKIDETILKSIEHLKPYNLDEEFYSMKKCYEIRADIPILREALLYFFVFHYPKEEKERIGFRM